MNPTIIEMHIEELFLHGFAASDRHRIAEAIEAQLTRLFTDQGFPGQMQSEHTRRVAGSTFSIAPGARPETIGGQIAQAIHGSLSVDKQGGK